MPLSSCSSRNHGHIITKCRPSCQAHSPEEPTLSILAAHPPSLRRKHSVSLMQRRMEQRTKSVLHLIQLPSLIPLYYCSFYLMPLHLDPGPLLYPLFHPLSDAFSASGHSLPPSSSSLAPTVHPHPASEQGDILMNSAHSFATMSNVGSSSSLGKCKRDARSSSIQPPSSKRAAKGKTADLDPVIISNNLNSTLNHMVDTMEKSQCKSGWSCCILCCCSLSIPNHSALIDTLSISRPCGPCHSIIWRNPSTSSHSHYGWWLLNGGRIICCLSILHQFIRRHCTCCMDFHYPWQQLSSTTSLSS